MTTKKKPEKYLDKEKRDIITKASKEIVKIRNEAFKLTGIDILDTDCISAAFIYEVVSQYDLDYNINFARNGEDAKSNGILIEQKATKVEGPLTPTGKPRQGAGTDAAFQFHAMGDLEYPRYIFVARDKKTLEIVRLYDISTEKNCSLVLNQLITEKNNWLAKGFQKRDVILLTEKFILDNLDLPYKKIIDNCVIMRDINT